jgi:hypothetical protein
MASHVVRIENLEVLVKAWINEVTAHCGTPEFHDGGDRVIIAWPTPYVLPGEDPEWLTYRKKTVRREPPFFTFKKGMFKSLQGTKWERIHAMYYVDNDYGNTIRLFDEEHFNVSGNQELYLELENSGQDGRYPDRVLFRGENLGKETQGLKKDFRKHFGGIWSASGAPAGPLSIGIPVPAQPTIKPHPQVVPAASSVFERLRRARELAANPATLDVAKPKTPALDLDKVDLDDVGSLRSSLPMAAGTGVIDLMGMCDHFFEKRHAYFQHKDHNNMPNNALKMDCSQCKGRTCRIGSLFSRS